MYTNFQDEYLKLLQRVIDAIPTEIGITSLTFRIEPVTDKLQWSSDQISWNDSGIVKSDLGGLSASSLNDLISSAGSITSAVSGQQIALNVDINEILPDNKNLSLVRTIVSPVSTEFASELTRGVGLQWIIDFTSPDTLYDANRNPITDAAITAAGIAGVEVFYIKTNNDIWFESTPTTAGFDAIVYRDNAPITANIKHCRVYLVNGIRELDLRAYHNFRPINVETWEVPFQLFAVVQIHTPGAFYFLAPGYATANGLGFSSSTVGKFANGSNMTVAADYMDPTQYRIYSFSAYPNGSGGRISRDTIDTLTTNPQTVVGNFSTVDGPVLLARLFGSAVRQSTFVTPASIKYLALCNFYGNPFSLSRIEPKFRTMFPGLPAADITLDHTLYSDTTIPSSTYISQVGQDIEVVNLTGTTQSVLSGARGAEVSTEKLASSKDGAYTFTINAQSKGIAVGFSTSDNFRNIGAIANLNYGIYVTDDFKIQIVLNGAANGTPIPILGNEAHIMFRRIGNYPYVWMAYDRLYYEHQLISWGVSTSNVYGLAIGADRNGAKIFNLKHALVP